MIPRYGSPATISSPRAMTAPSLGVAGFGWLGLLAMADSSDDSLKTHSRPQLVAQLLEGAEVQVIPELLEGNREFTGTRSSQLEHPESSIPGIPSIGKCKAGS